jgi:SWI/SNF-related matrix-associated actin-dependent regulator 1 of chromatin subfamily A
MIQLLPYQAEGVQYALSRRGTIIADEMGLGKTIQAIGLINADPSISKVLIVCPLSLKLNWWKEIDKCLTRMEAAAYITVVSYTETRKIGTALIDLLIVDEAQYIKNPESQRSQEIARLAKMARKVVLLTGTPFENRVDELWALLCIVAPDYWNPQTRKPKPKLRPLPPSVVLTSTKTSKKKERTPTEENLYRFRMRYCGPKRLVFWKGGRQRIAYEFKGGSNLGELNQRLRETCMIRRFKKDVLSQLPPKRRQIVSFPTNIQEDPLFAHIPEITIENYDDAIEKLRSNKVAFKEWSRTRHLQGLEKLAFAGEHISNVLDEAAKVILFAHHEDVIIGLENLFPGAAVVTGSEPVAARQAAVDRFQSDPRCRVFIGSIRAAGVGLTLTAASVVIFVEIDPNPAWMNQCEDRAHRIGQRDSVLVQYLVSDGSIDARLCKILAVKQELLVEALNAGASLTLHPESSKKV